MSAVAHPLCEATGAQVAPSDKISAAHPRLILLTTILASSLAFVDGQARTRDIE